MRSEAGGPASRTAGEDRPRSDGSARTVPSSEHGRGLRWRARYVDDEGREHAEVFARKADAQAWLDDEVTTELCHRHLRRTRGRPGDRGRGVCVLVGGARPHLGQDGRDPAQRVDSRVEPRWGDVAVVDVKTSAVRAWVARWSPRVSALPTIENAFGLLRQVLGAAVEDKRIPRNPCDGVRLPKREHADRGYLSHAQVAALAARGGASQRGRPVPGLHRLAVGRDGRAAGADFDMLRRRVNVSRSVTESGGLVWCTPKTWERRSVPFPAVLADELSALMVGKGRDELVFTDLRGGVLRNSNWRARVFEPAVAECQQADETFPTITPHDLRHTAAAWRSVAGANVKAVQRMLGHARASMTLDVYADLFDEDLDSVAANLDAAIRSAAYPLRTGSQTASSANPD